jgi:hypothetical protein
MFVLVPEDVAAGQLRQKTLDSVTDGLQLLPSNVLLFVLGAPKSSSIEVIVEYRAPSVTGVVRV